MDLLQHLEAHWNDSHESGPGAIIASPSKDIRTFSVSPENLTGEKGMGGMAVGLRMGGMGMGRRGSAWAHGRMGGHGRMVAVAWVAPETQVTRHDKKISCIMKTQKKARPELVPQTRLWVGRYANKLKSTSADGFLTAGLPSSVRY